MGDRQKIQVRTGGKLYLAGEYAILTPGQKALIHFIPLYLTAEVGFSQAYELSSDMFTHVATMEKDTDYGLIQEAVSLMEAYLTSQGLTIRPLTLTIRGKLEKEGKKLGIGSSGSVTLLVIKALAALYAFPLSPDLLFRLGAAVLLKRGDNGSMGDLAAIAYESLVLYQSFDRKEIQHRLQSQSLESVLAEDWGYKISPIKPRVTCDFLVGWTQKPALSSQMVKQVQASINPDFLVRSQSTVEQLERALLVGDKPAIQQAMRSASKALENLSPLIYTEDLQALVAASQGLDAVAKSSGAGGGDCGIALSFAPSATEQLQKAWAAVAIQTIYQERWCSHDQ